VAVTASHTRRQLRSVLVLAGDGRTSDRGARALERTLREAGVEILYLGREESAERIAAVAAESRANAVEVCVSGGGCAPLLRRLLRELASLDCRGVSIVVHKVE
jgi:methylmalonyl-CoA mutase cobalamin-binding subunit